MALVTSKYQAWGRPFPDHALPDPRDYPERKHDPGVMSAYQIYTKVRLISSTHRSASRR